jgi:prepilin-type N-terminal cleavage/methylation domain-containing protein
MQKRAFTLIELLVVIAIIALLLSVLMPSLRKAREQARNAVCVSHLHSWGTGFSLYGNDYDQKVCPALVTYPGAIVAWDEILKRYYADNKIRICASAKKVGAIFNVAGIPLCWMGGKNTAWQIPAQAVNGTSSLPSGSYGMNIYACYPDSTVWEDEKTDAGKVTLAKHWGLLTMKNGHDIPILGDSIWREGWPETTDKPSTAEPAYTSFPAGQINRHNLRRHTKSTNLVFYDSSVRHLLLPELWKLRWNREFDTDQTITFPAWMTK